MDNAQLPATRLAYSFEPFFGFGKDNQTTLRPFLGNKNSERRKLRYKGHAEPLFPENPTNKVKLTKPVRSGLLYNPPLTCQTTFEFYLDNISSKRYYLTNFIINHIRPLRGNFVLSNDLFDAYENLVCTRLHKNHFFQGA